MNEIHKIEHEIIECPNGIRSKVAFKHKKFLKAKKYM